MYPQNSNKKNIYKSQLYQLVIVFIIISENQLILNIIAQFINILVTH